MRYFTIAKIKKWCEQRSMSPLIDALNSSDSEIRKASILCLGQIGDAVALESLEYILKNDSNHFVRITAESAVENIKKAGLDSRVKLKKEELSMIYKLNIS